MQHTTHRGRLLVILSALAALQFADRSVLNLLAQDIKTDLQLSDTEVGLLQGLVVALIYSTFGIPIARWADRGNRVTIVTLSMGVWTAMVFYFGMAGTYLQLLLARMGAAVGEAGCIPPAQSLIGDYYSRTERARAISLYVLGGQAAIIIGFTAAGWLNQLYGWRATFFLLAAPGVALTIIAGLCLYEPRLTSMTSQLEPPGSTAQPGSIEEFKILWRHAAYRHLTAGFTLMCLFGSGIGQWVPAFLIRTHGIETGELGWWYGLSWGIGGAVGTYTGGHLVGRYMADDERLQLKLMCILLAGFIPLYLGVYLSDSISVVLTLMMAGAFAYMAMYGPLFALIQQVVPPNMRALAIAVVLLLMNLVGMGIGPVMVGALSDFLAPQLGDESLRVALVVWTPGYVWAIFHLLRARRYVRDDIESLRSEKPTVVVQVAN